MGSITRHKPGNTRSYRRRKERSCRPLPSCFTVYVGSATELNCNGAYYARVDNGYKVSPPPIGSSVTTLPSGAVDQNIHGTPTLSLAAPTIGHSTAAAA